MEVERKNREVEQARKALEEKAEQLALTSKYKSEFLANMSHELRTPLNSLLILADQLSRNQDGNLSAKQVDYAKTIHASGNDLLALINDILDLSKIESGTVTLDVGELELEDLQDYVDRNFRHVAESRRLEFAVVLQPGLAQTMTTDAKRLQQVLKNLLSNAFKFTERGRVVVDVRQADSGWNQENETLTKAHSVLAFSVADTGIGIPDEKQQIIFEAFQQADGSTSRKYGGTGLGLAISREIARMLGGEIRLASRLGEGSTFTLYLPSNYVPVKTRRAEAAEAQARNQAEVGEKLRALHTAAQHALERTQFVEQVEDDRRDIKASDRVILVVDNDNGFTRYMREFAHERGFKALVSAHGTAALSLAQDFKPHAITLDLRLPDIDGWRILDHLKSDLVTRHIPVYMISTEEECELGLRRGAIAAINKPISREQIDDLFTGIVAFNDRSTRSLLVVEDDDAQRRSILDLVGGDDILVASAATGGEALAALERDHYDCVVVDLGLPDMTGFQLIDRIRRSDQISRLPIVVYTGRDLAKREVQQLRRVARKILVKGVQSPERLLDETALCMHRVIARMPEDKRRMIEELYSPAAVLAGRRVLVVDDDIRNIFAMTSVLERHRMTVLSAENGHDAIRILETTPGIDVVLMDIMMPGLDGYDTMRAIRSTERLRSLPIIALTAKAMKGDREKCIEAGASDYIAKPVDANRLLTVLCAWLCRTDAVA